MVVPLMQSISGNNVSLYVVCVSPHTPCAWFCMSAVLRATMAEAWSLSISSQDLRGLEHHPIFFSTRIFALYLSGSWLGAPKVCWQHPLKVMVTCLNLSCPCSQKSFVTSARLVNLLVKLARQKSHTIIKLSASSLHQTHCYLSVVWMSSCLWVSS